MDSSQGILQVFTWNNHEVEVDEDGFIQQPELWNDQLALALARTDGVDRADRRSLEDHQLHPQLLPGVRDCAHDSQALQRDWLLVAGDLRPVSLRTGQGRVQSGGTAQTNGLRLAASFKRTRPRVRGQLVKTDADCDADLGSAGYLLRRQCGPGGEDAAHACPPALGTLSHPQRTARAPALRRLLLRGVRLVDEAAWTPATRVRWHSF